ncbi:unnamed protein product [Heligmosomoides polygyrus]|uniref:Glycosyltransferase family 92 protein n=1 Tax=Heligmosomoides polygyrus TaxID=6339 RepID=A0A183FXR2_HELPZ|nr:unnamed protein product [Heligmosomoides polygyrus]
MQAAGRIHVRLDFSQTLRYFLVSYSDYLHFALLLYRFSQASTTYFAVLHEPSTNAKSVTELRKSSQLIEKSVFLRYGDADPLTIFSAFAHSDGITVIIASYGFFMRRIFCRVFHAKRHEILPAAQSLIFPEYMVRCPADDRARFVALSLNADDLVSSKEMKPKKAFLSVCLAPLWGNTPKWLLLIEFIEYYKLQGADRFYVYKQAADNLTEAVLENYIRDGVLEVVNIGDTTNCLKRHRCRHEMQLQDCVVRTRGLTAWTATVDLDERIVINSGRTIRNYIDKAKHGELRFRCRWVLRSNEIPDSSRLPMDEWHNTSHVAPLNHTTKSIVQPTKVESMSVHQVLRFAPGAGVLLVPPEDAAVRHYRFTKGWSFFLKEAESFGSFEDTYLATDLLYSLVEKNAVINRKIGPKQRCL